MHSLPGLEPGGREGRGTVGRGLRTLLDSVSRHPSITAAEVAAPDLVVVPGLDDDLAASFSENRRWVSWLTTWHAAGARIAGSCTGAFLVADAGLLDGRPATTHWMFADELRRRYPAVTVTVGQMIVDDGDVITSGGATAFLNLVLYLVERFAGHDRANLAAKVLLVDGHRSSQLPYIAFGRERSHDDVLVHRVQQHIDLHLDGPLRISELAAPFGLSEPCPAGPPPAAGPRPTSSTRGYSRPCAFLRLRATRSTVSAAGSATATPPHSAAFSRRPPGCTRCLPRRLWASQRPAQLSFPIAGRARRTWRPTPGHAPRPSRGTVSRIIH
jgi:hypothetical protein